MARARNTSRTTYSTLLLFSNFYAGSKLMIFGR